MYFIVLGIAIIIISISLSAIILPDALRIILDKFLKKNWLYQVSALRLILGILFLFSAEKCSMPVFISAMGLVLIFVGISMPIIGRKRIDVMAKWWIDQKDWMIRIWGFGIMLFGIALAMAAMPA